MNKFETLNLFQLVMLARNSPNLLPKKISDVLQSRMQQIRTLLFDCGLCYVCIQGVHEKNKNLACVDCAQKFANKKNDGLLTVEQILHQFPSFTPGKQQEEEKALQDALETVTDDTPFISTETLDLLRPTIKAWVKKEIYTLQQELRQRCFCLNCLEAVTVDGVCPKCPPFIPLEIPTPPTQSIPSG